MPGVEADPSIPAAAGVEEGRYLLTGTVERVTFHNPVSGFCVLKVRVPRQRQPVAVVANTAPVSPGERVRAEGRWTQDPRHGLQFKADTLYASQPKTVEALERYLASGSLDGIGPVHAARLVATFGGQVLEVIRDEPWRLQQVLGIGPVRLEKIVKGSRDQQVLRDIARFLADHGLPPDGAARLHGAYGAAALAHLRHDPYQVARTVRGFDFTQADRLAGRLGLTPDAPLRLRAGLRHALAGAVEQGSCGLSVPLLLDRAAGLLGVEAALLSPALAEEEKAGTIVRVGTGGEACAYPGDLYRSERMIAERLTQLARGPLPWCPPAADRLAAEAAGLSPAQAAVLAEALRTKLSVLTGGPGVGKTTLVQAIVRLLGGAGARLALAAPTGRAAKRLSSVTGHPACTLHRLLEADVGGAYRRTADEPLDLDLLVVDEASMVDVRMMAALLAALPARAGLLLVGDADQLPSVGPGRVLADIIASDAVPVLRLTEVYRQAAESRIVQAAHTIRAGRVPAAPPVGVDTDFYLIETRGAAVTLDRVVQLVRERIPARFGLDPLADIQVLTPMNKGALGTRTLNPLLQQALNPDPGSRLERGGWRYAVGDRVMQVENDHEREIYNGDLGRIVAVDVPHGALEVDFDGRVLRFAGGQLDRLTLAYATTIHKAQGTEFPAVVIPLGLHQSPMLQRALLYTAVTRGRRLVVLVGEAEAMAQAVAGLGARRRRTTLCEHLRTVCTRQAGGIAPAALR